MPITHEIILDVNKSTSIVPPRVVVRVGDVATQTIKAQLKNDGADYSPSGNARLDILKADGTWARCSASVSGNEVSCTLPSQAVSSPGLARLAHFVFYTGTTKAESTEGFELRVLPAVDASDQDEAADFYDDMLTQLYEKWVAYEQEAEKNEQGRVAAETARASAENQRAAAENVRASAETARSNAEQQRATQFSSQMQNSQNATAAATGAASDASAAAANCWNVANQVAQGAAGESDIAKMKKQIDAAYSMLADVTDEFIYMEGTIYAPRSKASVSGSTITLGSTCSASGSTITLA